MTGTWHRFFMPGETKKRILVVLVNDSHDEDAETFEVVLSNPTDGAAIADGVGVVTIVNSDPMPAAWLTRFGRTVAEQALDGIAGRMAAPGKQGTLAGQALSFDPTAAGGGDAAPGTVGNPREDRQAALALADVMQGFSSHAEGIGTGFGNAGSFGGTQAQPQSRSMTAREALLGSSFTLTGEKDASGGTVAFWGRAAQAAFDGREGTFSLDGEVTTDMLGADYARGKWLVGLALTQSSGEGGYADSEAGGAVETPDGEVLTDGTVREGDGKAEASLTAAIPYAALQASERLKLWGALGYGTGEVTLKPAMGDTYRADTTWTMAAAGLRGDLLAAPKEGSGPALALTSDGLWARTSSEKTRDLAASDFDVTRLRLGLEGSYRFAMEGGGDPETGSGASLVPKLEIGTRRDGGDAGFGVELGGGIAWNDPKLGLALNVEGRTLLAHQSDDLKDRGFPAFGGRFTGSPHVGLGLATGARDYSLGWRLTPAGPNVGDIGLRPQGPASRERRDAAGAHGRVRDPRDVVTVLRWKPATASGPGCICAGSEDYEAAWRGHGVGVRAVLEPGSFSIRLQSAADLGAARFDLLAWADPRARDGPASLVRVQADHMVEAALEPTPSPWRGWLPTPVARLKGCGR